MHFESILCLSLCAVLIAILTPVLKFFKAPSLNNSTSEPLSKFQSGSMFSNNKRLIDSVKSQGFIKNDRAYQVIQKGTKHDLHQAMLQTDRKHYCEMAPYSDMPMPIGYGVTISAPHMHASALDHLEKRLQPGCRALDVGSGTGYLTACMARMVGVLEGEGEAIGIDVIEELVEKSKENVRADDPRLLESPNFKLLVGDGWKGYPEGAPYDAIHVGAAADSIPQTLIDQLAPNGSMFIPVGPRGASQHIWLVNKSEDGSKVDKEPLFAVQYVPLVKN